jgi:hypothetical protein
MMPHLLWSDRTVQAGNDIDEDLVRDLELGTLFDAMSAGDAEVRRIVEMVLLQPIASADR